MPKLQSSQPILSQNIFTLLILILFILQVKSPNTPPPPPQPIVVDPSHNETCITQTLISEPNYLTNGDFQVPHLDSKSPMVFSSPGNLDNWTSTYSQIGIGSIYNPLWTSQVLQLNSKNINFQYNQTIYLNLSSSYKLQIYCAAYNSQPLRTSGFMVLLNDHILIYEDELSDYNISVYTADFITTQINNTITIQGLGIADDYGVSCDNLSVLEIIQDNHRVWLNQHTCECSPSYYSQTVSPNLNCKPCSSIDPHCSLCNYVAGSFICTECMFGYSTTGPSLCQLCSSTAIGCLGCVPPSYLTFPCQKCDELNHYVSVNGSCVCDVWFYALNTKCIECSDFNPLCLTCQISNNSLSCTSCSLGYFPQETYCYPCSHICYGCGVCQNGTSCLECVSSQNYKYQLVNGTCQCQTYYYQSLDDFTCQKCTILDQHCLTCNSYLNGTESVYQCLTCDWGYFPQGKTCLPCENSLINCLNCTMDGKQCQSCDESKQYFLNETQSICVPCPMLQCLQCLNISSCSVCNETGNYYLNYTDLKCQYCTMQGCINCSTLIECRICDIELNYLLDNATLKCYPCRLQGCIRCITNDTCEICGSGYVTEPNQNLKCDKLGCQRYQQNLPHLIMDVSVIPKTAYTFQQCLVMENLESFGKATAAVSYSLLLVSIFSCKIVGLQLFGVLQIVYFTLADQTFVNIYLSPFLNWRYMNGFNLAPKNVNNQPTKPMRLLSSAGQVHIEQSTNVVPNSVQALGYTHSFIENINIMFLLLVLQFIVSLILIVVSWKIPFLKRISEILIKQVFITIFIFNCFNISFSAGLQFRYATPQNTKNYAFSLFSTIIALGISCFAIIGLTFFNNNGYGEYKDKFKSQLVNQLYIPISIVYRVILGFYLAYGSDYIYVSLFVLGLSLTFLLYNIVNLPFINAYQNYRANLCHFTQLIIIFVANFYSVLQIHNPMQQKSQIFSPAKIEIALILICLVVSIACLIYQVYLMCFERYYMKKQILPKYQDKQHSSFGGRQSDQFNL